MKLKKLIPLFSCIVILGVLTGVYFIVKNYDFKTEEEEDKESSYSVISLSGDSISSYKVTKADGTEWTFKNSDGVWSFENDLNFPLNQETASEMAGAISKITASRYIEEGDTGSFGLDTPVLKVEIVTLDGENYGYKLGETNSFNGTTYIMNLVDSAVYMFNDSVSEHFNRELIELALTDRAAETFDSNYLTSTELTDLEGNKKIIYGDTASNALVTINDSVDCSSLVVYYADADIFNEYGIGNARVDFNYNEAISVENSDGSTSTTRVPATYSVIFGNTFSENNEDGESTEYIYYTITDSTKIYKLEKSVYDSFMEYVDYIETDLEKDTEADTADDADTETDDK